MNKILRSLMALGLAVSLAPAALAETVIDGQAKRGIKLQEVGLNEVVEGVSPTTGLPLDELERPEGFAGLAVTGRYMPMLVQIDNADGGVGDRAPWGSTYADVVYESPLHRNGDTRISFLFSDLIPNSVGPVRSARVGHAYLREEWDAGFLYYGGQTRKGSSIEEVFKETGAKKKGVLFSGIVGEGKPWKKYYTRRSGLAGPHNVDANVAAMSDLIDASFTPPNHAFLFTDELPTTGEAADVMTITWGKPMYNSRFVYDADSNLYFRYMLDKNGEEIPYEDYDTQEQLTFANVIVQHTSVTWNHSSDAPVTKHIGEGNADIFMGGRYIAGYWKRPDVSSRTVFYDAEGNEIALQRGKTFISILPEEGTVAYE